MTPRYDKLYRQEAAEERMAQQEAYKQLLSHVYAIIDLASQHFGASPGNLEMELLDIVDSLPLYREWMEDVPYRSYGDFLWKPRD